MRNFIGALCATTVFAFAQQAAALTITAKLTGFENTPVAQFGSPSGGGGGIGTFEITGGDALTGALSFLTSAPSFEAICLEPQELVRVGNEYIFNVVDLKDAPSSRPGGMGAVAQQWFETGMNLLGATRVEDIGSGVPLAAAQSIAWEAAHETSGTFSRVAGSVTQTGPANGLVDGFAGSINGLAPESLDSWGLVNIGEVGAPLTRSAYRGQDFSVFNASPIDAPAVMALFGLGLMGLGLVRKIA